MMNNMEENLSNIVTVDRVDFEKEGFIYKQNICYGNESSRQILDLFYSKNHNKPMPVIIWIHGGAWSDENLTQKYRPEKELAKLAEMGFFIACIEYRLLQHEVFPAQISDCKCAVRFLRKNANTFGIDPYKIGVWGESAGGHLASLLGTCSNNKEFEGMGSNLDYSSSVQAVCSWYSPYNMLNNALESSLNPDKLMEALFGGSIENKEELVWAASPIKYAKEILPPFLVMHGDADQLVPFNQTVNFFEQVRNAGNPIEMVTVPNQGHGFFTGDKYYIIISQFFKRVLQN